jgi:hypothetical protein
MTILPFAIYIFKQAIQAAYKFPFLFIYLVSFFLQFCQLVEENTVPISMQTFLNHKIKTQLHF